MMVEVISEPRSFVLTRQYSRDWYSRPVHRRLVCRDDEIRVVAIARVTRRFSAGINGKFKTTRASARHQGSKIGLKPAKRYFSAVPDAEARGYLHNRNKYINSASPRPKAKPIDT